MSSQLSYKPAEGGARFAEVRCAMCPQKFDGLVQREDASGRWTPEVIPSLNASGWVEAGGVLFCGRYCAHKHAYAKARDTGPLKAVTRVTDASWQPTARVQAPEAKRPQARAKT